MLPKFSTRSPRYWVVLAVAGIFHLLLLYAPVAFIMKDHVGLANPRVTVFLIVVSVWYFVESVVSASDERLSRRAHGPRLLPLIVGMALLTTFWASLAGADSSLSWGTIVAGSMVMALGLALRCVSVRTLGSCFLNEVTILPSQPLVTNGIYGRMRHPSETGTLCLAFGGTVLLGSPLGMVTAALLLLPCLIWRTRLEDQLLRDHFASEYDCYAEQVPAFLPALRRLL